MTTSVLVRVRALFIVRRLLKALKGQTRRLMPRAQDLTKQAVVQFVRC